MLLCATVFALGASVDQFKFDGGAGHALASACAETAAKLVVLAENSGVYQQFNLEFKRRDLFASMLAQKLDRQTTDSAESFALRAPYLPRFFVDPQGEPYQIEFLDQGLLKRKDCGIRIEQGKWSTVPGGTTLTCNALKSLELRKPLAAHWLIGAMVFSLSCQGASEEVVLDAVSKALPATLIQTDRSVRLDLDVPALKRAWLARFERRKKDDSRSIVSLALFDASIAAIDALSNEKLKELMKKPRQFYSIEVPADSSSPVTSTFQKYIQLYRSGADLPRNTIENVQIVESERKSRDEQFSRVSWNKPWRITFYNLGRIDFLLPTDKENAWVAFSSE